MREWQSQVHVKHYCKYHVVFVPKVSKEIDLWNAEERYQRYFAGIMPPAWNGIARGRCDEGSRSHAVDDPAEVQRSEYHRVTEKEISHTDIQGLFAGDPEVHQEPGTRRKAPGADEISRALTIAPPGAFIIPPALRVVFDSLPDVVRKSSPGRCFMVI